MERPRAAFMAVALAVSACANGETSTPAEPEPTGTTESATAQSVPVVLASAEGVVVSGPGGMTQVSSAPAAAAYGIGDDFVVFQDAQAGNPVYPPDAAGPVRAWSAGEVRELPTDPAAARVELLDAGLVEGVPVALIAQRFGEVTPDDTFEELVRIDLRDDAGTTIMRRRPTWEWGHSAARLLPDGDVVGLVHSSTQLLLARWTPKAEESLWMVEVGRDTDLDLLARGTEIAVLGVALDAEHGFVSALTLTQHDPATGSPESTRTADIDDPEGELGTGLFCREWVGPDELGCGRSGGRPVAVTLGSGSFSTLPGGPGAIPTVLRTI